MSDTPEPNEARVEPFTPEEYQVICCAMAGNFPDRLAGHRLSALRKLVKLDPDRPVPPQEREPDDA